MKTLADLKRDLVLGTKVIMVSNYGKTDGKLIGVERYVVKIKSNGFEFAKDKNEARGSFLDFPKASLLEYDGNSLKIYSAGDRNLTEKEREILANKPSKRPENAKQCEIDMMTDGSQMYWKDKHYLEENNSEYLAGNDTIRGLRYDYNTHKIKDETIKGECVLEYKIVN